MFSDATLSDRNIVLCYVLSQYLLDNFHKSIFSCVRVRPAQIMVL